MMENEYLYELECGHVMPSHGERDAAYCRPCRRFVPIVRRIDGYSVRCVTEGCRGGFRRKRFGAARLTAVHEASRHVRLRPTHTVQVREGTRVVEVIRGRSQLGSLDFSTPGY